MSDQLDAAVEAAWAYEGLHVNALFRQWAQPVLDAAGVTSGSRVLDVACGTGVVAREALARVGPIGLGGRARHRAGDARRGRDDRARCDVDYR